MKKHPYPSITSVFGLFRLVIGLGLLCLFFSGCERDKKGAFQPIAGKLLLVCDDWNVDNWYSYVDSFEKYQMTLTFYVSHFHTMTPLQKAKLLDLQVRGHEIAYHTLNHIAWDTNFSQAEIDEYLRVEIDSGVSLLRSEGLNISSFCFPGDRHDPAIFQKLNSRFKYVRFGHFGFFEYWKRRREYTLVADPNEAFRSYSIDNASIFGIDGNMDMIIEDLKSGKNVALLMHSLTFDPEMYTTHPDKFFHFVRLLKQEGIPFSTVNKFYN